MVDSLGNSEEKSLTEERLLLIDTCGVTAGIALCVGPKVVALEDLAPGNASAQILLLVRTLLLQGGWKLEELNAVGVVSGPGSFTGMRAGLAAAKGLCEATGLRMVAVSRLEVLVHASALDDCYAALDAGRGELYVRDGSEGREWLASMEDVEALRGTKVFVVAETNVAERLKVFEPLIRPLNVADSLAVMRRHLRGGRKMSLVDANYVRDEGDIYRRPSSMLGKL